MYASPPPLWGREDHVRELFGGVATGFDFFMAPFPPMVTAKAMMGERFNEMRARIVESGRVGTR